MVACVLPLQIHKECSFVLISIHLWAAARLQSPIGHPFFSGGRRAKPAASSVSVLKGQAAHELEMWQVDEL